MSNFRQIFLDVFRVILQSFLFNIRRWLTNCVVSYCTLTNSSPVIHVDNKEYLT